MLANEPKMNSLWCPQSGEGAQNGRFTSKVYFTWRKSAWKFLSVNTVFVWHAMACLSIQKWFVGDVFFHVKILLQPTHPFINANFQSVFAYSATAVTSSKKGQLTQIGNPLRAF